MFKERYGSPGCILVLVVVGIVGIMLVLEPITGFLEETSILLDNALNNYIESLDTNTRGNIAAIVMGILLIFLAVTNWLAFVKPSTRKDENSFTDRDDFRPS